MLGILCSVALAGLAGSASYHQELVQPSPGGIALAIVSVSNACTRVEFVVSGTKDVTGTLPSANCGDSPFKIMSGGPMEWKKNPNRRLKVQVRVVNQDSVSFPSYFVPRLVLSPGDKTVLNPAGTSPVTIVPVNPDSTRPDGTAVWLLQFPDTILVAPPGAFPPGVPTNSRTLEFQINAPTVEGRFDFSIVGERFEVEDDFPAVAPDTTPQWIYHDTSFTAGGDLKRILDVEFDDVSASIKKAAVDSVGGTVIGGSRPMPGHQGFYLIHVPGAATSDSLRKLAAVLRRQPGVRSARPLSKGIRSWLKPADGPGWARTELEPQSVACFGREMVARGDRRSTGLGMFNRKSAGGHRTDRHLLHGGRVLAESDDAAAWARAW
jgi:hypothetical protein